MRYKYKNGVKHKSKRRKPLVALPVMGLMVGGYILLNTLSPALPSNLTGQQQAVSKTVTQQQPNIDQNRLYIPKIGVDVEIVVGVTEDTLEGGAWHRKPENGDPRGGNFVLAAHRFNLGFTPGQTRAKSPFYHIDTLSSGDEVYVDYSGKRYAYEITDKYSVQGNDIHIEERSKDPKMTLYSCDLRGPNEGREVVEARLVGPVAWESGKPKIKSSSL